MKIIKVKYSWGNYEHEEQEEIEDAEWDAMTEREQEDYKQELIDTYQGNCGFEAWCEVEDK